MGIKVSEESAASIFSPEDRGSIFPLRRYLSATSPQGIKTPIILDENLKLHVIPISIKSGMELILKIDKLYETQFVDKKGHETLR